MLKTIMLSATALLLISAAPASTASRSDLVNMSRTQISGDYEACMLMNGCFWTDGDDSDPGFWTCSSSSVYMNCLSPADPIIP
jgi:hypothetical protein